MRSAGGYAAFGPDGGLRPFELQRRDLRADDVAEDGLLAGLLPPWLGPPQR